MSIYDNLYKHLTNTPYYYRQGFRRSHPKLVSEWFLVRISNFESPLIPYFGPLYRSSHINDIIWAIPMFGKVASVFSSYNLRSNLGNLKMQNIFENWINEISKSYVWKNVFYTKKYCFWSSTLYHTHRKYTENVFL